ncbi:MAG: FAD-dependent oxidoreductase [Magnetovibrio sp.]|nr:FAD-dependent oxidoreductase [Magnetovibrio sp.]
MKTHHDIAVIGAGPAGMAAAATAAARGADVLVLDEQPGPGGQIYRGANAPEGANDAILGDAYGRGRE